MTAKNLEAFFDQWLGDSAQLVGFRKLARSVHGNQADLQVLQNCADSLVSVTTHIPKIVFYAELAKAGLKRLPPAQEAEKLQKQLDYFQPYLIGALVGSARAFPRHARNAFMAREIRIFIANPAVQELFGKKTLKKIVRDRVQQLFQAYQKETDQSELRQTKKLKTTFANEKKALRANQVAALNTLEKRFHRAAFKDLKSSSQILRSSSAPSKSKQSRNK